MAKKPKPVIAESANGTRGTTVIDSQLVSWTIDSQGRMLRAGQDTDGRGSLYLYWNHSVYGLGTDNQWWKFNAAQWLPVGLDPSAPPVVTPPAPPPPTKTETPSGTYGLSVTDALLSVYTLGEGNTLYKDGVKIEGYGTEYCYYQHTVYVLGTDNAWWKMGADGAWTRFGEASPIPLPRGDLATATCVNLAPFGAFWGVDPFINRLKRASRWWHKYGTDLPPEMIDTRNWLRAIAAGEVAMNLITVRDLVGEYDYTDQRAGTHLLLWRGDLTLEINGQGTNPPRQLSEGRYVFEIDVDHATGTDLANPALNLIVTNKTDGARDFQPTTENGVEYPALIHADDEVDFLAGKKYQRSFINALSNAVWVRPMDWNMCVMEGADAYGKVAVDVIKPEHYQSISDRTYVAPNDNSQFFPPEMLGHLCAEADVKLFNCLPSKTSDEAFHYWYSRFMSTAPAGVEVASELSDEDWNFAWPWNIGGRYLTDKVAPNIKVVDIHGKPSVAPNDQLGCASAERALRMWEIAEQYIPRERHKRILGGQFAWIDSKGGMLSYVDPVTGKRAGDMADYYAVAPYWGCDLGGLTLDQILDQRLWEQGDDYFVKRCLSVIDAMQSALSAHKLFLAKYAPNCQLTCYEGGGWLHELRLPRSWEPRYAEAKEFDNFCRRFADGEPGRIVYEYYMETFIRGNFAHFNQYFSHGYYYGVQVGLNGSQHRADTARQALFRTWGKK